MKTHSFVTQPLFAIGVGSALLLGSAVVRAEGAPALSPLELTGGVRALHRSLTFNDTPAQLYPNDGHGELLSYKLPLGPSAFVQANVYPLAFSSRGPEANLGLTGSLEVSAPTRSVFAENTAQQRELTSHSSEFFLGIRGRLPIDVHELALSAGYGEHRYTLSGDEADAIVPDLTYKYVRLIAEGSFRFDALTVGFHVGTRLVRDTGGLRTNFFPNTRTQSVEAGLLLGYTIAPRLELVGGFDLTRYAFNFNPVPDTTLAAYAAGGGVDQYTSGWLGVRFSLQNDAP